MTLRGEVLVFGCRDDDLAALTTAFGRTGPVVRVVDTPERFASEAVSRRPLAVFLGVGTHTMARLEVVPLIHAVRKELPVIVVAEDDSLELERNTRLKNIFYYLVHPVDASEIEAVLQDLVRRTEGSST